MNYYRRDKTVVHFLQPGVSWDPNADNFGIQPQEAGDGARSAAQLAEDLKLFLSNLASFMPFDYVSEQLKSETHNLQECWDLIYEIFEIKIGTDTFMNYSDIKREPGETYRCLFERMCGQVRQHLPKGDLVIKGVRTGTGEKMTVALYNLIALNWLDKISPQLKNIVKKEFSKQFAEGQHLYELVATIAPQIDSMLSRHEVKSASVSKVDSKTPDINRVEDSGDDDLEDEVEQHIRRIQRFKRKGGQGNKGDDRRSYGRSDKQGGGNQSYQKNSRGPCTSCELLKKTVKSDKAKSINIWHDPRTCTRKHFAVRLTEAIEDVASDLDKSEEGNILKISEKTTEFSLQSEAEREPPDLETDIINANVQLLMEPTETNFNKQNISDLSEEDQQRFLAEICRVETAVPKADSPSLFGNIEGKGTEVIFDEGAQLNVLDDGFARELKLKINESPQMASAANKTPLKVTGQTAEDVWVKFEAKAGVVKINLGKVITVSGLGTKILVGEPGKRDNKIQTIPHEKRVEFVGKKETISMPYYRAKRSRRDYKVARVEKKTTLYPGESIKVVLDEEMTDRDLAVTPRAGVDWLAPRVRTVTGDAVELYNNSKEAVTLKKGDQVADIRTCCLSQDTPNIRRVYERMSDSFSTTDFSTTVDNFDENVKLIEVDPDSCLTKEERNMFREVSYHYKEVFTPRPGKYNGYYGEVGNRLNFASIPAQKTRVYTPNYSPEMKKILAEKLDKLVEWGVLVRPEDYNIQVEVISSSLIVPKHEPGEYRVVTDFTGINTHLKKIPSLSPTIAEARQSLARAKFIICMDLSNYFYQGGVCAEDAQYLATMHPFKGVLVYSCMPQGVKGASETSYERIERIFGDMVQEDRMATMADGLYPKGMSVLEVLENYAEVLRRAALCGLTFKPTKTIICPRRTELFGWDLDDGKWMPTVHTKSTLAAYEKPKTAKQLRSYLGAWKQLSSCISDYAAKLHPLEMMIAGKASKEWLTWTEETEKAFEESKKAAGGADGVYEARPGDKIHTYSDFSQANGAIGGRMMLHRLDEETGETNILLGGHFSATLDKHKKNWLACEGEAAGIRLTLSHFAPQIRSSVHDAVHHTDSKPCVQAWARAKKGAYSASSRLAAFLTDLSSLSVELVYTPGKEMFTSDFASRHPPDCSSERCQVCKFVHEWEVLGDNAGNIRRITLEDIQQGRTIMPFTQRKVLRDIQFNDKMHNKLREIIEQGHLPDKRKTGGDFTKLKLLHNIYKDGRLKVETDGAITIKAEDGHYNGRVMSLPAAVFRGFATALHVRLDHPSKGQLGGLMKRYFYTVGMQDIINDIQSGCQQCTAMKILPKILTRDTTSEPKGFGSNFAADVIEINSQNIFVIRESVSQFTQGAIITDQKASTLEEEILKSTLELIPDQGAVVRVDGAKAFQSLEISGASNESYLSRFNIRLELGRTFNRNKNPQAENANKEVEKEILRIWPGGRQLNNIELAIVMKNINSRIRYHGYAASEILLRRDLISHDEKDIKDRTVIELQAENREVNSRHQETFLGKSRKETPAQNFEVGQLVFIRSQLSKLKARELFIVVSKSSESPATYTVRKATGKLRMTTYTMLEEELIAAPNSEHKDPEVDDSEDENGEDQKSEGELIAGPSEDLHEVEGELITGPSEDQQEGELIAGPSKEVQDKDRDCGPSANDVEYNYRGRPRRQAARRAQKAWNQAGIRQVKKIKEKESKPSSAFTKHGGYLAEDDEPEYIILPTIVAKQENIPPVDQQNDEAAEAEQSGEQDQFHDCRDSPEQDNQQGADFTKKSEESEQRNSIRSRSISVSGERSEEFSGVRAKTKVTVEKITPATPSRTFSHSDIPNVNSDSASSDTQRRRIDPFKVGEFGDLLDRIQERERSRSTPRESAKKPKDYYKHLHKRGRDQ